MRSQLVVSYAIREAMVNILLYVTSLNDNSDNIIVRTIINVGLNGTHSIMGGKLKHLGSKYGMEECNVMKSWDEKCKNECESVRVCEQIRKMCSWRIGVT